MVEIEDGVVWKRHIDQMLHADASQSDEESSNFVTCSTASPVGSTQESGTQQDQLHTSVAENCGESQRNAERRYPQRDQHPPDRYY